MQCGGFGIDIEQNSCLNHTLASTSAASLGAGVAAVGATVGAVAVPTFFALAAARFWEIRPPSLNALQ